MGVFCFREIVPKRPKISYNSPDVLEDFEGLLLAPNRFKVGMTDDRRDKQ